MKNSLTVILVLIFFVINVNTFDKIVRFEPSLNFIDNKDQEISLNCSISSSYSSLDNKSIEFAIKYGNNFWLIPELDFRDSSLAYIQLNYSYSDWKSMVSITNDSFEIECMVLVETLPFDNCSAQIIFVKGYNNSCTEQTPCNTSANLICGNFSRCDCDPQFIGIGSNSADHYDCYPKVGYNETCVDDRQCRAKDSNTDCGVFDAISKRCQCSEYYAFDGIKCYSNWYNWLCFQWSLQPFDVIIILMAFSVGLSFLLIVISISLYLRSKKKRALIDSKTYRYPSSLSPKVIISKYFHESEDGKHLKCYDYGNKL